MEAEELRYRAQEIADRFVGQISATATAEAGPDKLTFYGLDLYDPGYGMVLQCSRYLEPELMIGGLCQRLLDAGRTLRSITCPI